MESSSPQPEVTTSPSAKKVILTSFLVDLLDVGANFAVALLSGSVIMLSQVLQGASDLIASGLLLVGVQQSNKKPDHKHPFGHGREMFFWAMISAFVTFGVTATLSVYLGWQRFLNPEPLGNLPLAYLVLAVTTVTNFYSLSLSYKRIAAQTSGQPLLKVFFQSPLIESKTTFVLDLMGTAASLLGLISLLLYGLTGNKQFDGLGAMVIGLTLGLFAFLLIRSVKELLVGKSASFAIEEKIRHAALTIPEVEGILDLRTMYIGPDKLLVNLEVHLQDNLNTDQIELLTDRIKQIIQTQEPSVHHIQVELETPE